MSDQTLGGGVPLIPALDLLGGRVVRLTRGDFATATTYATDPVALAHTLAAAGATHLHVVDLDGARDRQPRHLDTLCEVARVPGLRIDFSGGLTTTADVAAAFAAGAAQVVVGSQAAREPTLVRAWLAEFGAEAVIIGADFRDDRVLTHGWQQASAYLLDEFVAEWLADGATTFLCTDVRRDGALTGPATARYTALTAAFPQARILASGGVSGPADVAALRSSGVAGVVVGKALYEGLITI